MTDHITVPREVFLHLDEDDWNYLEQLLVRSTRHSQDSQSMIWRGVVKKLRAALTAPVTVAEGEREAIARYIFDHLLEFFGPEGPPSWFPNGHRFEQDNARAHADAILAILALRQPPAVAAALDREAEDILDWVETWVSNPVGSYSVYALDGLFAMTRDKINALRRARISARKEEE